MRSLTATDLYRHHGGQEVLRGVSVAVTPRSRIGVVGPNGVGKSTLLRILAGLETPDGGTVVPPPSMLRVGYLPQEPEGLPGETVREHLARRTGVAGAAATMDREATAMEHDADAIARYSEALERFVALGGGDLEARMDIACRDVGLAPAALDAPLGALSGGDAARAGLAALVLSRFDVLLLDEPTNNLDFAGLERLERFVDQLDGAVVVVSHDRAFLSRSVTTVLELEPGTGRATSYTGGWEAYLEARAVEHRRRHQRYDEYAWRVQSLRQRERREKEWAQAGVVRAKRSKDPDKLGRKARAEAAQNTGRSKVTEQRMARLERVEKPFDPWELRLTLPPARRSGDEVASLIGAVIPNGDFRLGPIDLDVRWGERVAILGANGSGKSTLLHGLLGRLPLEAGKRRLGPSVVVGELDQQREAFAGSEPLRDAFRRASGLEPAEARSLLAKFGLASDHVERPANSLSPGERTRAVLALSTALDVNLLVLDEPTNHLDLEAIEQLEAALEDWGGTVLLVTHDRELLENVAITRTVELTR